MRTLSRPMFNMGGPIKQGIMHGIREPYRGGGAALVGNPVYPQTGGREHHNVWLKAGQGVGRTLPHIRRAGQTFKNWAARTFGSTGPVTGQTTTKPLGPWTKGPFQGTEKIIGDTKQVWTPKGWVARDPIYKIGSKIAENKGMLGKPLRWAWDTARTPTTIIGGVTWYLWPDGSTRKDPPPTGIEKPGGYPGAGAVEEKATLSQAQRDAFAKSQRDARVQKYLDMMGYDRSKKTAIADALIDASKIVSDRGTLDRKNITAELINPAIQALSKRLDKPEQIREAVGLMMTKAGLEKEMYDAKPGTIAKNVQDMVKSGKFSEEEAWAVATKASQGAVADIQGAIATGKVGAGDWPAFVRSTGAQHGENVEVITDEQIKEKYKDLDKIPNAMEIIATEGITDDGIYVIGSETVRIEDGKVTQLR